MKKYKVYCNGSVIQKFKTLEEAEIYVRREQRKDLYERDVQGYTNPLPTYEIKNQ